MVKLKSTGALRIGPIVTTWPPTITGRALDGATLQALRNLSVALEVDSMLLIDSQATSLCDLVDALWPDAAMGASVDDLIDNIDEVLGDYRRHRA